jgi:hypothetical protein
MDKVPDDHETIPGSATQLLTVIGIPLGSPPAADRAFHITD